MSKPTSATLNSKIRGEKRIEFSEDDKNLISTALSLIWQKTEKKVEVCWFERDKVRLSYNKNEGYTYFDLNDQASDFSVEV